MTLKTEAEIERLVSKGCYEDALGITVSATKAEVARAHIRQLHRFTGSESTREALNQAKTTLVGESAERKIQRLVKIDQLDAALMVLEQVQGQRESAYICYMFGYILYRMGRYVESGRHLASAFELSGSPFHAVWLGYALERQGKLKEALEKYLWAIEQRGNETEYRLAGNICFHIGDFKNACVYLEKAISLGCRDEDVSEKVLLVRQKQKYTKLMSRLKNMFNLGKAEN